MDPSLTTVSHLPAIVKSRTELAPGDCEVIELWLHGRSAHTQRGYAHDVLRFLLFVERPLLEIKLRDLQDWVDSLTATGLKSNSLARATAAIKSLLTFAHKTGYLPFNVGTVLQLPHVKNTLAERILPQDVILALIHSETKPRNAAILRLLYVSGVRVQELCDLRWRDVQPAGLEGLGQITVYGKGGKTRAIRLTYTIWTALQKLRESGALPDDPVFRSNKHGGHLNQRAVRRIILKAAKRAGLAEKVSPHWFRHAHASHALDANCPIHLVQATLGHADVKTTGRYLHAKPTESSSRFISA